MSKPPRIAIYPGSFDPFTNGHLDIVERASLTFDRVIVGISNNVQKNHVFSLDERIDLTRQCVAHLENVVVETFAGLLVDYARRLGVKTILRGLRATSDFEYEFQLATMNRKLAQDVETLLMMTGENSFYVSSHLIREVAQLGGNVSAMVPAIVFQALGQKFVLKSE